LAVWRWPSGWRRGSGCGAKLRRRNLRVCFRDDMGPRLENTQKPNAVELIVPENDFGQGSDGGLGFCYVGDSVG